MIHYDSIRRRPNLLFCCFIEVTKTVVKSVSDGLRDCESETQLNLNRPLRITLGYTTPGPRHLSRPVAAISTYANMPARVTPTSERRQLCNALFSLIVVLNRNTLAPSTIRSTKGGARS